MQLGELTIESIQLDPRSRDDIPQILLGLQFIYTTPSVRKPVFKILEEVLPERTAEDGTCTKVDSSNGRPGMPQWQILVLGVLRLGLNADYDRIHELANQHKTIRQMLGHSDWFDDTHYTLATLQNNLRLFTPEILDRINQEVIQAGHTLVQKHPQEGLSGRCDSFVLETHVHYPTDINLLLDAIRKVIGISAELATLHGLPGWRQHAYHQRQFKKAYRKAQRLKHSSSKDEQKKEAKQQEIKTAHQTLIDRAQHYLDLSALTRQQIQEIQPETQGFLSQLHTFSQHAERQINQIDRRVLQGEKIPHSEKVFSLFQPHTEWINKGKAGVPVELGLRVCIMEDNHRFILHHQVMERTTDDKVAVAMVAQSQQRFPTLRSASFDKGFHSPSNQKELKELLDLAVLPKKGRHSKADKERETQEEFGRKRKQHSAVESAINALEVHGLDKCSDHGIEGFKRYVAMAVVSRNIQRLGAIIKQQQQEEENRKRGSYKKAA